MVPTKGETKAEKVLNGVKVITFVGLIISVFVSVSYLITYSFLYNYYFVKGTNNLISSFSTIRWFVPFHDKTILYTTIIIDLVTALFVYIFRFFREKNNSFKVISIYLTMMFHFILSVFFINKVEFMEILRFSIIWLLPLSIAAFIVMGKFMIENPFKVWSGFSLATTLLIIISFVNTQFNFKFPIESMVIFYTLSLIIFPLVFGNIPYKSNVIKGVFIFPVVWCFVMIGYGVIVIEQQLFKKTLIGAIIFLVIVSFIITIVLVKRFGEKMKDNKINFPTVSELIEYISKMSSKILTKEFQMIFTPIILFLFFAYVLIPKLSGYVAISIRDLVETNEERLSKIYIKDGAGQAKTVCGMLVAEENGVLYISTEAWELETIKSEYYYISSEKCLK